MENEQGYGLAKQMHPEPLDCECQLKGRFMSIMYKCIASSAANMHDAAHSTDIRHIAAAGLYQAFRHLLKTIGNCFKCTGQSDRIT